MGRFFLILLLLVGAGALGARAFAEPMTLAQAQKLTADKYIATGKIESVKIRPDGCLDVLAKGDKNPWVSCVTNTLARINDGEASDQAIDSLVQSMMESRSFKPSVDLLRPVLRPTDQLQGFDQISMSGPKATHLVIQPFGSDVSIAFVFDAPHGMRYVTEADLKEQGIAEKDLLATALKNFAPLARQVRWERTENSGHVLLAAVLDTNYESSLLLDDDIWNDVEKQIGGPIIVAAPARGMLGAVRADDPVSVAALREVARNQQIYPVSTALFKRENGKWVEVK